MCSATDTQGKAPIMAADNTKDNETPNESGGEESRLDQLRRRLEHIEAFKKRQEKIKRRQARYRAIVEVEIAAALEELPVKKIQDVMSELYWVSKEAGTAVRNAYKQAFGKFPQKINPARFKDTCLKCGMERIIRVVSWADYERETTGRKRCHWHEVCAGCAQKKDEEERQRVAAKEALNKAENEQIQHLRTMPYKEYLQTDHWKTLRTKVYERDNFRCQLCNSNKLLNAHHKTYERRGCERLSDLIVLCKACHEKFHDIAEEE